MGAGVKNLLTVRAERRNRRSRGFSSWSFSAWVQKTQWRGTDTQLHSCLRILDRGVWRATVPGLKDESNYRDLAHTQAHNVHLLNG